MYFLIVGSTEEQMTGEGKIIKLKKMSKRLCNRLTLWLSVLLLGIFLPTAAHNVPITYTLNASNLIADSTTKSGMVVNFICGTSGYPTSLSGMIPEEGELFCYDDEDRLVRYRNDHGQHDPTDEIEKRKMLYRHKYKTDSNARKKAIADIEKDGKLSFKEAFYWYQYGDGSTIHVDASKLDLGSINVAGKKVGEQWVIPTLSLSKDYNVGLVYGRLKVEFMGSNSFRILHDEYNFDIQFKGFFKWSILKRNFETIGASILHGTGTPFIINFNGLYHNK